MTTSKLVDYPDCPKCGRPDPARTWLNPAQAAEPRDVLECSCPCCGYKWRLLPKDAT